MRFLVILFLVGTFCACTNDQTSPSTFSCDDIDEVSFKTDILPIIETSCSYSSGCHGDGSALGVFNTYEGIKPEIDSEDFRREVLIENTMPPSYATQGPTELTSMQLGLIDCWVEEGYPNN